MHYAKKSLGQNYLIDLNIVKKIINLTKIYNKKNGYLKKKLQKTF